MSSIPAAADVETAVAGASLRLADAITTTQVTPQRAGDGVSPIAKIVPAAEVTLDAVQRELDAVRGELEQLRRRDDQLQFYMNRLDEELRLAARLQQDFLPKSLPKVGGVKFHTLFRPAGHVSGDLYDVMRLDESHVGFYVADAVGHGMPAALLTMFLKQALVTKEILPGSYRLLDPAQTMFRLNEALVQQQLSYATFATALYGHINIKTLEFTFARGGHPNPVLLTKSGELRPLDADGSLLGIFPGEEFTQSRVQLSAGDRVFIYSDGIELAFSHGDTIDTMKWRDELTARRDQPTEQILRDLADHVDRAEQHSLQKKDDLTVIVLEVG